MGGAWRIDNGQTPHRDFYNFLGDLPLYMTDLGIKLRGPSMSAIDYGNAYFTMTSSLVALWVLRRRTSAFFVALITLYIALLAGTPRSLGNPYDWTDHAMLSNRYGETVLAVYVLVLFVRPLSQGQVRDWAESALAGVLLSLLLGCKLNYFAVGVGLLAAAWLSGRLPLWQAGACAGFAVIVVAILFMVTRIGFGSFVNDCRTMAACQSLAMRFKGLAIQRIKSIWMLPGLLVLVWEAALERGRSLQWRSEVLGPLLMMAALYAGAVLLLASNTQVGELPVLAIAAFAGAETIRRQCAAMAGTSSAATRLLGATVLVWIFLAPTMVTDLKTMRFVTYAAVGKRWFSPSMLQSTFLRDFRFVRDGTRSAESRDYAKVLDEGIQLLRGHLTPGMRLSVLLFSDPYEVALGIRPARGGVIAVDKVGLVKRSHPSLSRLLGDATHLLVARDASFLREVYGKQWDALHLQTVARTENLELLKVPSPAPADAQGFQ